MKKIILIIAVVMLWSFTTINTNDPYCMGWEKDIVKVGNI